MISHLLLEAIQRDATPDFQTFRATFGAALPLLDTLSKTSQDPEWHAEGDVAVHTDLVLKQVYTLLEGEAAHLSSTQRGVLILGALLHDTGKPLTTRTRVVPSATCSGAGTYPPGAAR